MTGRKLRLCRALILCCLIFIWGNSLLPGEVSGALSDWVKELLLALFPGDGPAHAGSRLLRKLAHFTEFALLGLCLGWRLRLLDRPVFPGFFQGAAAACIDETIQIFVPGRGPGLRDVLIDCGGVAAGMILLYFGHTYFSHQKQPLEDN